MRVERHGLHFLVHTKDGVRILHPIRTLTYPFRYSVAWAKYQLWLRKQ